MTRFNSPRVGTKTKNLAGGEAFSETPKLELVSILLTSFVKDQFYRSSDEGLKKVTGLLGKVDPLFSAKAAVYARTKYGMRSISHVVAGELAKLVKGEEWTKRFYDKVVFRPDDMTEILSYYMNKYGKPVPNSLKKGLGLAINKFNEYQLAKYRGEGNAISMVDLVNIIHPKPSNGITEALTKLMKGTLKSTQTWETKMTQAGQKAKTDEEKEELKKDVWKELVSERKIGYFALLRNLRNMLEQSPDIMSQALEMLVDENLIKKSLVLPFRFTTAIKEIESVSGVDTKLTRETLIALNKSVETSLSNVPEFPGSTLVVLDVSGSMDGKPVEIGSLFSAVLMKKNNADFMMFSDDARYVNYNPNDSLLTISSRIEDIAGKISAGTNFHSIFQTANKAYDRIIILSDMQGWMGYNAPTQTFRLYCHTYKTDPKVYSFDLQGYGTLQFPERNIFCLAGFSERIFDVMKLLEKDKNALISEIESVEI
jgi:60 kDa SS-A/Ro ribonucleoprotein